MNLVRMVRRELHFLGVTCHFRAPRRYRYSSIISSAHGQCQQLLFDRREVVPANVPELILALHACSAILRRMSYAQREVAL
jgi:hypothetical protein